MKATFSNFKSKASKAAKELALTATVLGMASAQAAVDTTAVTDALTAAGVAIAAVGAAWLAMKVGARVFKWIAQAI